MNKVFVKIEGIHCEHCISTITKELLKNKKIRDVKIIRNIAHITYNGKLTKEELIKTITDIDYITKEEDISDNLEELINKIKLNEFIIILIIIIIIGLVFNRIFGFNIFNMIPTIDSNITYGMLIITGILTSIHCISMCGAINLVATINYGEKKSIKRPLLYNLGRVISYTIIGGIAGFIGSVISINHVLMGIIILIAAIIMLLMALNMLGIFNFKLPHFIKIKRRTSNSFIIGLLNGLMPCGPLQAMQLYALSTGNTVIGAISMFLFAIGTVPLMLIVGIVFNLVKGKTKIILNKIASVLIFILSLVMLNRGLLTLNIDLFKIFNNYDSFTKAIIKEDYQVVEFDLQYDNYEDIIVNKGIPVRMIINVDKKYLTGCNNEIYINEYGIKQELKVGVNIIEFTPTETGDYVYTCWMNMIKNNIKVIDDESYFKEE